jgi:hypothetical protein
MAAVPAVWGGGEAMRYVADSDASLTILSPSPTLMISRTRRNRTKHVFRTALLLTTHPDPPSTSQPATVTRGTRAVAHTLFPSALPLCYSPL